MALLPITATCDRTFRASRQSGLRELADVRWIVLHDEESSTAISAARFFADPREPEHGGPAGSAHLCVDDAHCFRTLDNNVIPWASASSFLANLHGFHIEQAGFARWSSVVWLSHLRTLNRAAYKTALHLRVFPNVAVRFVTADDLPRLSGVTTHNEISKASRRLDPRNADRYTHSDPGPFWPRRLFMRRVRHYLSDLSV